MKVFKFEAEAGLSDLLTNNTSIAFTTKIEKFQLTDEILLTAKATLLEDVDTELYYLTKSILATSTWNKNDDVFSVAELWNARKSPIHTPTNIGHDHDETVGHIIDTWVINSVGDIIDDSTEADSLPDKIHLCNASLIYKLPRSKSKKAVARAEKLIEEIENGTKFVSMECIFPGFDYAVISPENKHYIVARSDETSFLTKHLRIYGGQGEYNGYKIGRFLKDMVFSGKGYVDNPANPESVIFDTEGQIAFASSEYQNNLFKGGKIIIPIEVEFNSEANQTEKLMADNNEVSLQIEIKEAKATIADLQKQLSEAGSKKLQEKVDAQAAELTAKADEIKTLNTKVTEEETAKAKALKDVETVAAENATLKEQIAKAEADKVRTGRITTLVEGGVDRTEAEKKVDKFLSLSDEQFTELSVDILAAAAAFKKMDDKKEDKKDDTKADDTEVLDTAKPEGEGATAGALDDKDEATQAEQLRAEIGAYLSDKLNIKGEK